MKLSKKILHHSFVLSGVALLAALYVWLVHRTTRWRVYTHPEAMKLLHSKAPYCVAFWHSRLLMMPPFRPRNRVTRVVISHHTDGEIIARCSRLLGVELIRGSSRKGARGALKGIFTALRAGDVVSITPDGPRGPREVVGGNIIAIARKEQVPIVPVTYCIRPHRRLKSWDRFLLPKPFGRGVFIWGEPLWVPEDADTERLRVVLEERLKSITLSADER